MLGLYEEHVLPATMYEIKKILRYLSSFSCAKIQARAAETLRRRRDDAWATRASTPK